MKRKKIVAVSFILILIVASSVYLYRLFTPYFKINKAIGEAKSFLLNELWDESKGAYRECPSPNPDGLDKRYAVVDNHLAYIFHTEYESFKNYTKAEKTWAFLIQENFTFYARWMVLSLNPSNYSCYQPRNDSSYADLIALDGIYYAKAENLTMAKYLFNTLICKWYDLNTGLIFDTATLEGEGRSYYKVALALILAYYIGNPTYINLFTQKLMDLQRNDGSWLTDDKWGSKEQGLHVYPNTETMILILLSLDFSRNFYMKSILLPQLRNFILIIAIIFVSIVVAMLKLKLPFLKNRRSGWLSAIFMPI